MSKDPTRNIDRYKIRGGQMNAFEFHQNQGAVSEQRQEHGNWTGAPEEWADLPPDKAKAERIRQLLAKHGESLPQADGSSIEEQNTEEKRDTAQTQMESEDGQRMKDEDLRENAAINEGDFTPTHGQSPQVIKEMTEYGETERRTARQQNKKQTVRRQSKEAAKGKQPTLNKSKPGTAKDLSAKKERKQPARKSAKVAAASTSKRQSGKQTTTTRSAKKVTTSSSGKQTAARKSQTGATARNSDGTKSASSRQKVNGKAATRSTKTRRTTETKRGKSSSGKSR